MTDEAKTSDKSSQETVTAEDFFEAQRLAREMHERLDALKRDAAARSEGEQRRMASLSYAMASYGMGGQVINPPPTRPETIDILRRANEFDAFIRGEAQVVPIEVNIPGHPLRPGEHLRAVPADE